MSKRKRKIIKLVVGARPEIIRMAPIIKELKNFTSDVDFVLLHTGQHYSKNMSDVFFDELGLELPYKNLNVGSLPQYEQLVRIIKKSGEELQKLNPDIVCVWGDTTSSLGVALAANKIGIKLAHIEAGCRSYDSRMAEEYNRRIIDHISDVLFPLAANDKNNLITEKVMGKIYSVGDPLLDIFKENIEGIQRGALLRRYDLGSKFALMTLHRAENVDNKEVLKNILNSLADVKEYEILFAMHPRTKNRIEEFKLTKLLEKGNFKVVPPLKYRDLLGLLIDSNFVITDSGGFQKEAFFAKKPCITIRKSTEWLDTVQLGVNKVINPVDDKLSEKLLGAISNVKKVQARIDKLRKYPYGRGNSSRKIAKYLIREIKK